MPSAESKPVSPIAALEKEPNTQLLRDTLRMMASRFDPLLEKAHMIPGTLVYEQDANSLRQKCFANASQKYRSNKERYQVLHGWAEMKGIPGFWTDHAVVYDKEQEVYVDTTIDTFGRFYGVVVEDPAVLESNDPLSVFALF